MRRFGKSRSSFVLSLRSLRSLRFNRRGIAVVRPFQRLTIRQA